MSEKFEVRIGQTWRTTGKNKQGEPCEVWIKINDMYFAEALNKVRIFFQIEYSHDGVVVDESTPQALHEEFYKNGWILDKKD